MLENVLNSQPSNFSLYPLLRLAICFAAGIFIASFLDFGWQFYLAACLLFAFLSVVFLKRRFVIIFICAAFAAVGGLHFHAGNPSISTDRIKKLYDENFIESGDPLELEGVLQSAAESAPGGFFLLLKTERAIYKGENLNVSGNVRLFAFAATEQIAAEYLRLNLRYGSRIRVACNPRREDSFQNAGVISRKQIFDRIQIDAAATIKSPLLIEKIEDSQNFAPLSGVFASRQFLIDEFRNKFNVSTAGVLIASLLGNKYFLDKPTAEIFREGGTFHVLVISGLHITFIGGLTLLLIRFFTNKRLWQFLFASSLLWTYSLAVGAEVPVVRACVMFTILLFSQVLYRRGTLLNALGACAFALLVWRPDDLFSESFHLTFVSVGAIVTTAFPLIEKLRAIGRWSPSAETPFPPNVSVWLKRFCETIYWRESVWKIESSRRIWSANLFKSPYLKWLEVKNLRGAAQYIFEAMIVSASVQIWLLPLLVVYFHRVSVISIFMNIWVGAVIALQSFAAFLAIFFAQFSDALALPLIELTEILNWMLVAVPKFFIENNWASFRVPVYTGAMKAVYVLYFVPVIVLAAALNLWNPFKLNSKQEKQSSNFKFFNVSTQLRVAASLVLIFGSLIIFHPLSAPQTNGKLQIDFLDVGQGDAALIAFPNGETLLVDGGGKINFSRIYLKKENEDEAELFEPDAPNIGEMVVSQFLWEKGYSKIDYILATHADADHIQGLTDVAKNFRVRAAIFGRMPRENAEFAALYSILQKRGIESILVSRGDILNFDDVKIEILFPENESAENLNSENDNSIVFRLIYGERKFLFTGDAENEAEKRLLDAPEFLRADVVKVAHHGSRTSSAQEFVDASKAEFAIIPVGRESRFGHPHKEVLERWNNSGARVLTTGEHGTISISSDGRDLNLKTFLP